MSAKWAWLLACATTVALAQKGNEPATWVENYEAWHAVHENRALGTADAANLAWWESYLLDSYVAMFSATGDRVWLERFVVHADSMIRLAQDAPAQGSYWPGYHDGFLGWGTARYDSLGRYQEYLVHDGRICLPVAGFVKLVFDRPDLQARFVDPARRYLSFVEDNIIAKWHNGWQAARGSGENLAEFGGWANLPQNQFLVLGELLLVLSEVAESPLYGRDPSVLGSFYSDVPDSMARVFAGGLVRVPKSGCYTWGYWPVTRPDPRPEDVSHANLAVSFCLESSRRQRAFQDSTLARMANTLTRLMWNRSDSKPEFSTFVDGTGNGDRSDALFGWLGLAAYSDSLLALVTQAYESHSDWTAPTSTSSSRALVMARLADAYRQHFGQAPETPPALDEGQPPRLPATLHASPNPFRASTKLLVADEAGAVGIYNSAGRLVLCIPAYGVERTAYSVVLDLSSFPPGTYFVRAGTGPVLAVTALP